MNKNELNNTLFKDAKKWWVESADENSITIQSRSPLGESLVERISVKSIDELPKALQKYADDFDTEKHARYWYNKRGKRGTPLYDMTMLREDARAIKYMLLDLAQEINESYKKKYKPQSIKLKAEKMKQPKINNATLGRLAKRY